MSFWALKYESKQNNKKYDKKIHYELISRWHTFYPQIHSQAAIWSSSNIHNVSLYFMSSLSHLILTVMVFLYRTHPFFLFTYFFIFTLFLVSYITHLSSHLFSQCENWSINQSISAPNIHTTIAMIQLKTKPIEL